MVRGKVLSDLNRCVRHVGGADYRRSRLCIDEVLNVSEAVSNARVAGIVDQNEQLQSGIISSSWNQLGHLKVILALRDLYIFRPKNCQLGIIANGFVGNNHMYRCSLGRGLLLG